MKKQQNNSDDIFLTDQKGKGKVTKTQQSEILTGTLLQEVFEGKARNRKEKI